MKLVEYSLFMYNHVHVLDAESGWSGVQTITISGETISSSPPSQTTTLPPITSDGNDQPQSSGQTTLPKDNIFANPLFMLVVGVLLGGTVVAVVMAVVRRHLKTSTYSNGSLYQILGVNDRYA
jgi:hypothetical protein